MSEATIEEVRQELKGLRTFMHRILGTRLSKMDLSARLGICPRTLDKRISVGQVCKPIFGYWLLSDFMEHEESWKSATPRAPAPPIEIPEVEPVPVAFGTDGHHLYRHFDCDGALLYVGISQSALHRLKKHRQVSSWFNRIARVEMTVYGTREDVLLAEKIAIQREKPLHNIQHARKAAP